jgi:hypothetical protein
MIVFRRLVLRFFRFLSKEFLKGAVVARTLITDSLLGLKRRWLCCEQGRAGLSRDDSKRRAFADRATSWPSPTASSVPSV